MKIAFNRDRLIDIGFYGGLAVKAANAVLEIAGGFLMIVINHDWLDRLILQIALPELREDPQDYLMNYFVTLSQNSSSSTQHLLAYYMLLHGGIKLAVLWLLWKRKLWAFPPGLAVFGIFVAYEIFSYIHTHSLVLLLVIILDLAIVTIVILEYRRLKTELA